MNWKVWSAIPMVVVTVLAMAAAATAIIGNSRSTASVDTVMAGQPAAPRTTTQNQPPVSAPAAAAPSTGVKTSSQPSAAAPAAKPARSAGAISAKPAAQNALANNLGWRLGTEWTISTQEYASYLEKPQWVATELRFKIVEVDPSLKSFTASVRFADAGAQPQTAQGDLLRVGYKVTGSKIRFAWVQPQAKGPKLTGAQARRLIGQNFISLEVPDDPFAAGSVVPTSVPGLGKTQGNKVKLSQDEAAVFAKGAPWWVSYNKGKTLKAQLTSFSR